jgi:KaiC/GvpD/RAD55 family RecA-like ATPase
MLKNYHTVYEIAKFLHRHRTTVISMRTTHEDEYHHNRKFRRMFDAVMKLFLELKIE